MKINKYQYEFHPSAYELTTINDQVHCSCCDWLASSFDQWLHERTIWNNTTWNPILCVGYCLLSWSTLLIASTKHLKFSIDDHFHFSLPNPILGLPMHFASCPYTYMKWICLADPLDDLIMMSNLKNLCKFFFYIFTK
jgi:hypothetical protein